jgi:pentafunctional AROM polypeptide
MPAVELSLCPMPRNLLAADGGVVLELNFAEDDSPLLSMARQTPGWVGVPGLEVLLEQGYEQLRAWTARRAPRKAMRLAALEERERRRRARQDAV